MRRGLVLALVLAVAAAAFAAGSRWSGGAPSPAPSGATPVVALDPSAVDLGPRERLHVDWSALAPPSAALPEAAPADGLSRDPRRGPSTARPAPAAPRPDAGSGSSR